MREQDVALKTNGLVLHAATGYDLLVWLFMGGRERTFRDKVIELARLHSGEAVLDVGCGTGSLAIAAQQRVGALALHGIDASPQMLARARKKARKAGLSIDFQHALAEAMPFPDETFDVVLSTVMLHHLPLKTRQACAREMRRVLKPGGRVLAVDFGTPQQQKGLLDHFFRGHGHTDLSDIENLLVQAGLSVVESGAVGMRNLVFVRAARP